MVLDWYIYDTAQTTRHHVGSGRPYSHGLYDPLFDSVLATEGIQRIHCHTRFWSGPLAPRCAYESNTILRSTNT